MFHNVLVGVDGQSGGRDAIALGKHLLAEDGGLTLAHVHLGEAKPTRGATPAFEAAERERSRQLLEAARAEARIVASFASTGRPSADRGLHELAERSGADLLVVGSTSRGLAGRGADRGRHSIVFEQAENRLHTIKAILVATIGS